MRICIALFLLIASISVQAQKIEKSAVNRYLDRLMKEKTREFDFQAAADWLQQHPGQPRSMTDMKARKQSIHAVSDRSGDIVVSGEVRLESEVHAAINPLDTANIITASIRQDPDNILDPLNIAIYYSKNFGQTWASSQITFNPDPTSFTAGGGDPVLAFDKSGKAWISWLALGFNFDGIKLTLYTASSSNKGQTWSTPIIVDSGTADLDVISGGIGAGTFVDKQWMDCDQSAGTNEGALYISYTRFEVIDSVTGTAEVLVKKKPKNASSFGPSVRVHQQDYQLLQFSSLDVDIAGNVHVLFFAGNDVDDTALYHAVSTNGGTSFQPEKKISAVHYPDLFDETQVNGIEGMPTDRIYPCPHLAAGNGLNELYATWSSDGRTQKETEGYDVWFSRSLDGGQTWSTPDRIYPGTDTDIEQYYPAITVNPLGTICLAYYDRTASSNSASTHHVVTFSKNKGQTWSTPANASMMPTDFNTIESTFGIGEYTQIVATAYNAIPVWADGRDGDTDLDIYAAIMPIGGQSVSVGEAGNISHLFSVQAANPSKGNISLNINLLENSKLNIQVFSSDGKLMTESTAKSVASGVHNRRFDLSPGLYWCKVETDFGSKIMKMMVE
ncbi:MAG: T9SS type A sorting domain-containing protein [Saprospiraceae bacterium]|nr:T9SS type A sorting domain-containing protein [Saprospiraceae bacterium]